MTTALVNDLSSKIKGDVKADRFTRQAYSIDASIYQIEPAIVTSPRCVEDVRSIVEFSRQHQIPVIARGAGTGLTGGCLGSGIIIDFSTYMNRILDIDYRRKVALCEPGVVQDQLNEALSDRGYRLGPDTSTGNRATLGGMLGNNASGSHSIRYGKMVDHVTATEVVLANGDKLRFKAIRGEDIAVKLNSIGRESNIYRYVQRVRETLEDEINARYPAIQRRVSGYNLDELVKGDEINVSKLITGSEGTLGVVTEIETKIVSKPATTALVLLGFSSLNHSLSAIESLLEFQPHAIELIDRQIIESGRSNPNLANRIASTLGTPEALLIIEFDADSKLEIDEKIQHFEGVIKPEQYAQSYTRVTNPDDIANIWRLRKSGLGLLMARRTNERAIAFLEDIAVPPSTLGSFIAEFRDYIRAHGKEAGFYGHAGAGCIHVRPMLDISKQIDIDLMTTMMHDISDMVLAYGGAISGEHGDGLVRSWLNRKMFGSTLYESFRELKSVFDPEGLMNPGKIVDAQQPDENLRIGLRGSKEDNRSILKFDQEGGMHFHIGMCNGNGECRKLTNGVMCPSFQVSRDERDSTRARAAGLAALWGDVEKLSGITEEGLFELLDLCIECKGCKRECPSQIDMAKLKSEFLYRYYLTRRRPLRDTLFSSINRINRVGSFFAPLSNKLIRSGIHRIVLERLNISPGRTLPEFSRQRFSRWYKKRTKPNQDAGAEKVALFIDTFTEFNFPEIGKAAIKILEKLNCQVIIPEITCCGRPSISKGLLDDARSKARITVNELLPYARNGYTITGLEPSCILTIKDEYPALLGDETAIEVSAACRTIDHYLNDRIEHQNFNLQFNERPPNILVHGHCHQRAVEGIEPMLNVLRTIPRCSVNEINSGCCGMAGSFGYEKEHYDFSLKIGETRLFPRIRTTNGNTVVVANGVSCRQQIAHGTDRTAVHMIQILADMVK